MKRREVLSICIKAAGATVAGAVGAPLAINAFSPVINTSVDMEVWKELGPAADFPVNQIVPATVQVSDSPLIGKLGRKIVFVWRKSAEEFVVYSRSCTDLGCPLTYDPGSEWFFCPCHGGIFDKEGQRRAGPPKYPMWRYNNRVQSGNLEIDLASVPSMA